jgi:hypothetical protein
MSFETWDIGFAYVPNQEDGSVTTDRPVVIIDNLGDKFTICPLSKNFLQGERIYKYTIRIEKDSEDALVMGLSYTSIIILDRHGDLPKFRIWGKPKKCPDSVIEKIEDLLEEMKRNGDYR